MSSIVCNCVLVKTSFTMVSNCFSKYNRVGIIHLFDQMKSTKRTTRNTCIAVDCVYA